MNLVSALAVVVLAATTAAPAGWNLETFQKASTLEFHTVNSAGEGHWSTVWVVVSDGAPYLRLGTKAATRIDGNADGPYVKIRIGGQEFDRVIAQSAPEMAGRVAAAMADKYWMDIFVRYMAHPLTIRLVPVPPQPQH